MNEFKFGYREVIPDQTISEKWKEILLNTGGTQSTLQDIKVAERAGGYCYQDSSKYYTRNRFIYWRISHDILELVEQSLDVNLIDSRVRYRFTDTPILDGITIHELYGKVVVLIPTVCSVHYLSFPHPDRIHKQQDAFGNHPDLTVPSIFAEASVLQAKDPSSFHVINNLSNTNASLPYAAASVLGQEDEGIFIFSYPTGSLLLVRMIPGSTQCALTELKQDSIVPRFLSGIAGAFRGGKSSDSQVAVSVLLHCIDRETYALVLGRDGHLKIWSCAKGSCVSNTDVLADTADSRTPLMQGSQNHILRKSVDSDSQHLTIGVFLCFANKCQFHILRATFDGGMFLFTRLCTLYAPEQDLVDFSLDSQRLWAVWRGPQGECTVDSSSLQRPGGALWVPAVLEPPPLRDYIPTDPSLDPRQAYSDYIFYPGRFPFSVITRALSIYCRSAILHDVSISPANLKQRVCIAVESEIQAEVMEYELSDDDYLEIASRCWSRFYSCCAQYNATGNRPLGILLLPPVCGLMLLRKSIISLLRPMDILEHLVLCGVQTTPDQLVSSNQLSNDPRICQDLLQLMSILVTLEQYLTDDIKGNIERELRFLRPPDHVIADLVEELVAGAEDCTLSASVIWELCRKAGRITDLYQVMHLLLETLRLDKSYNTTEDSESSPSAKMLSLIEHLYSSPFGVSTVTETVHQMAVIRFSVCRNLLLLQHILLEGRQQDWSILESIRSVCMPDTVVFTQAYFTIVWLSESTASPVTMLETHQQRLSSLQLTPILQSSRITSQRHSTLPELFILSGGGKYAHVQMSKLNTDFQQLPYWHNSLLTYAGLIAKLVWPVSGSLVLGEWLLSSGQLILLQQYVRLLSKWCEWNNCSRKFILAVALLGTGERRKALDLFQFAANGILSDEFLVDKVIPDSGATTESKALIEYYLKVINILELHDALDCAISMAETAISRADPKEPHLATLHSIIFVHHLTLGHYEQAYHALDANPDRDRRKDCLRQLVGCLLEKRELDILMSFPYVSMMAEFESIVESRARAMSIQDNFVYDFLYAFHVQKGNIRRAGTVMYEQALVLSQMNQGWALERQVKGYLACLNCLALVEPDYQFIVRPRAFIDNEPVVEKAQMFRVPGEEPIKLELNDELRKRLQDSFISISEFQTDDCEEEYILQRDIEVLTMHDIKKELEHVTARLRLSKLSPEAQISSYSSPNELVGLLVNVGMFVNAANLCTVFNLPYDPVFEALATVCVRLMLNDSPEAWSWLAENNIGEIALGDNSPAKVCWSLLQNMLDQYEAGMTSTLHKVVAKRVIGLGSFMPHWLEASYKRRNAGELIRLYMTCGRLIEAHQIGVDYVVAAALGKGKEVFCLKNAAVFNMPALCLPINTLMTLLTMLKEIGKTETDEQVYHELYLNLKEILKKYAAITKRATTDMEQIQWTEKQKRDRTQDVF